MKKLAALGVFVACIGVALLAGWATFTSERIQRDNRGCPVNLAPSATTAVLLDQSDALLPSDELRLTLVEDKVLKGVSPDTLVLVFALTDDLEDPVTWVGEMCVSPEPKQTGEPLDYLTSNPPQMHRQWTRNVRDKLRELLSKGLSQATPQTDSPISQALYFIARRPEFSTSNNRRMIVVSDMLERTYRFSLYHRRGATPKAALAKRPKWKGILRKFDIVVFLAHREDTDAQSRPRFTEYWSAFEEFTGAQSWECIGCNSTSENP